METSILIQLSVDDLKEVVREVITDFFDDSTSSKMLNSDDADEFGGIDLAVRITGKAKQTIYTLVSKREIPHFKRGNKLYFSRRDLLNWIEDGKRKTTAEIISNHFSS